VSYRQQNSQHRQSPPIDQGDMTILCRAHEHTDRPGRKAQRFERTDGVGGKGVEFEVALFVNIFEQTVDFVQARRLMRQSR
jgi:hypothetical protein